MQHPKSIGDRSTLAIMTALQSAGYTVLLPFGENTRYDLVIDDGTQFGRVQCKTGRLRKGAVIFPACSSYAHHANPKFSRRDYLGDVDYFAIYCLETSGVYLVPLREAKVRTQGSLRVDSPRNSQRERIRMARHYQLAEISIRSTAEPGASAGASGSCA
jgi:PD-(D/E)XK endonuclease